MKATTTTTTTHRRDVESREEKEINTISIIEISLNDVSLIACLLALLVDYLLKLKVSAQYFLLDFHFVCTFASRLYLQFIQFIPRFEHHFSQWKQTNERKKLRKIEKRMHLPTQMGVLCVQARVSMWKWTYYYYIGSTRYTHTHTDDNVRREWKKCADDDVDDRIIII